MSFRPMQVGPEVGEAGVLKLPEESGPVVVDRYWGVGEAGAGARPLRKPQMGLTSTVTLPRTSPASRKLPSLSGSQRPVG